MQNSVFSDDGLVIDLGAADSNAIMSGLAKILHDHRGDFLDMLSECAVKTEPTDSDEKIIEIYCNNLHNKELLLGSAYLVNFHNQTSNADGENEINNDSVKSCFCSLCSNFLGEDEPHSYFDLGSAFGKIQGALSTNSNGSSGGGGSMIGSSTLGGAASGGVAGAIAGAVGDISKTVGKISDNKYKKQFGARDSYLKKQEAKNAMLNSIIQQRMKHQQAKDKLKQTQQENKGGVKMSDKTKKILIISGVSLIAITIIGIIIYKVKKAKNAS